MHGDLPALAAPLARLARLSAVARAPAAYPLRAPYFCAGCPHNTSTRVPEGSRALAGIGCHYLALHMPRHTKTFTHMGGEGAAWMGVAPFVRGRHAFQNIGDGTYFHSGLLAIRAAAASGVDITYKILFNDAVAMTGGQALDGQLTVPQVTQQVAAEGAKRIVVVTDEPEKYSPRTAFAPGVTVRHRDELDAVQRELRDVPGLTVLVYDQTCAAEKRRRRKRGKYPDPPERVFINDAVCEGCGDCSEQSNCVAVRPLETELGRKRTIDQSSCNKDFSCLKGFCPSFVTVRGVTPRKAAGAAPAVALPEPAVPALAAPYAILVTGIGGTGVITIGALLGMAAHLEGRGCSVLDFTGLAQKNGAVASHVRLAPHPGDLHAVRVGAGAADLVLGCDMVVAASPSSLATVDRGRTRAVINGTLTPTAQFVLDRDMDLSEAPMQRALRAAAAPEAVDFVPATALATALMGDAIATNLFMLGYAFQKGLVPLSRAAIERAIELNGTAVESGKAAFAWGRLAAHDRAHVERAAGLSPPEAPPARTPAEWIEHFAAALVAYQDARYADRFRQRIARIAAADDRLPGRSGLTEAAARSLHKLMAYKDEYEVARLYTDGAFAAQLARTFDGTPQLAFHLAPPLFARRDPVTGELRKRKYGAWMLRAMGVLARMKGLRGTRLDPFGRTAERRAERQAIADFERTLDRLAADARRVQLRARGGDRAAARDGPRLRPRQGPQPGRIREEARGAARAVQARRSRSPGGRLSRALPPHAGQHVRLEEALDHQHERDRRHQQQQRGDRRDLVVAAHARVEHEQRQRRHVGHADEVRAGELVERLQEHEDRARDEPRRGERQRDGAEARPRRRAEVARRLLQRRVDRRERRRRDPHGEHQPVRRVHEHDAQHGAVQADLVEHARDVHVDGQVRHRLRQQEREQDEAAPAQLEARQRIAGRNRRRPGSGRP